MLEFQDEPGVELRYMEVCNVHDNMGEDVNEEALGQQQDIDK